MLLVLGWSLFVVAVARSCAMPPAPLPVTAPASAFSEARALQTVRFLASEVGVREAGTPAVARARDGLLAQLRTIAGVEAWTYEHEGVTGDPSIAGLTIAYRVSDVIARLPGSQESAILLTAHYDSPPASPGAADNASGVSVAIETLRALSTISTRKNTVLVVLTDGEECGLLGARAFARHPLAHSVAVTLNMDAGAASGRSILLRSSPGTGWLLRAFARTAPRPHGNLIVQQLLEGDVLHGVETDMRAMLDLRVAGLDFTTYEEGYPYHTRRDNLERLGAGMIQHEGANVLALTRELIQQDITSANTNAHESVIFYDVLGQWMLIYTPRTGRMIAVAVLLLSITALVRRARGALPARVLVRATVVVLLALPLSVLLSAGFAMLLPWALHRPHAWFARPWLLVMTYGSAALVAVFALCGRWLRYETTKDRSVAAGEVLAWAVLAVWTGALALAALRDLSVTHLALGWTLALSLAMHGRLLLGPARARLGLALGAGLTVIPAAVYAQTCIALLLGMVPRTGFIPAPFALDPVLAVVVAVLIVPLATVALQVARTPAELRNGAIALAVLSVLGLVLLGAGPTYTPDRPRRILLEHVDSGDGARLVYRALDFPPLLSAISAGTRGAGPREVRAIGRDSSAALGWARGLLSFETRADASGLSPVALSSVSSTRSITYGLDASRAADTRSVTFTLRYTGETHSRLRIARDRLLGWSLSESLPVLPVDESEYTVDVMGLDARGRELTLQLRGSEPITVHTARFYAEPSAALREANARLPAEIHAISIVTRTANLVL